MNVSIDLQNRYDYHQKLKIARIKEYEILYKN